MLQHPVRVIRLGFALLCVAGVAVLLGACGSSSSSPGNAQTLLRQTFSGEHRISSGRLQFSLSITPSGSTTLTKPISLSFSGPFQSRGTGKLPASDFTVSISAQGHTGSLAIVSTGSKGYVTMSSVSYQLPAASFQKLEQSFSSVAGSSGGGSGTGSGVLAKLGINPLNWLSHPQVVGSSTVGGAQTTHIRAQVDVAALLRDLSTFLQRASSLGISGASSVTKGLSAATQQKVAGEIENPRFDLWTGDNDKTVRKLEVGLTLPVKGEVSSLLGGLSSAGIELTLAYADLNQPQTITAPTKVEPYKIFAAKLDALLREVESGASAAGLGSSDTTSTGSSTTGTTSSVAGATAAYSKCIQKAGQNVAKMQRCASKLGSGG